MRFRTISGILAVGLAVVGCTARSGETATIEGDSSAATAPTVTAPAQQLTPSATAAAETSDNLGLAGLVDQYMLWRWTNPDPFNVDAVEPAAMAMDKRSLEPGSRLWFERQILAAVLIADVSTPNEQTVFGPAAAGPLFQAHLVGWNACLQAAGYPTQADAAGLTPREQKALVLERGFSKDQERNVLDDCWEKTRIRWGKDAETDRLLGELRSYYLKVAEAWVESNPGLVVPLPAGE